MEFRQPYDFIRRQSPNNVADVQTQTTLENLSDTLALVQRRCPYCMQLQPNMNTFLNHHPTGETIQYPNGSQDWRAVNDDLDNLGGNTIEDIQGSQSPQNSRAINDHQDRYLNTGAGSLDHDGNVSEELHAPIQCTDHDEPPMTRRTFAGRGMKDPVSGIQYKIARMHLELVPYEEHN